MTGKELWRLGRGGDIPVPTPVIAHGLIVLSNAHGGRAPLCAVRLGASGDITPADEDHWRWRLAMAERIAERLDAQRYGVTSIYVFGSTKNATAGPASDIDLLVHDRGDESRRTALATWLDGWSAALAELNYLRTGYRVDGLLDVHYVTDDDIARQTSYAAKIGAVTDAARRLPLGGAGT